MATSTDTLYRSCSISFPHEDPYTLGSINSISATYIPDETVFDDERIEHAPLFSHESSTYPDIEHSPHIPSLAHSEATGSTTSLTSNLPFPALDDDFAGLANSPGVEVFPCNKTDILQTLTVTKTRLDEDDCFDTQLGSPPAQVLSNYELRERASSRRRSSIALNSEKSNSSLTGVLAASPLEPPSALDAAAHSIQPVLRRPRYGSCLNQRLSFQEISEEKDEDRQEGDGSSNSDSDERCSPLVMKPSGRALRIAGSPKV